jgi:ferrous iron transport protein B
VKIGLLQSGLSDAMHQMQLEHQEKSYIGRLGKWIEPVMAPLGFDWKISVSLLAGITAKEIVVSTLGVLYLTDSDSGEEVSSLQEKLKSEQYRHGPKKGEYVFSPLVALSLMIFILIYFPCVAVVAAIRKESGHWKWALFTMGYTTVLAWLMSFAVFNIGKLII